MNLFAVERRARLKRASQQSKRPDIDLFVWGRNYFKPKALFSAVHCGCAQSDMRSKLFIGCVCITARDNVEGVMYQWFPHNGISIHKKLAVDDAFSILLLT